MIKFNYSERTKQVIEIEHNLKNLSLAFSSNQHEGADIQILEGDTAYEGYKAITKYLQELHGELHKWHYSNC